VEDLEGKFSVGVGEGSARVGGAYKERIREMLMWSVPVEILFGRITSTAHFSGDGVEKLEKSFSWAGGGKVRSLGSGGWMISTDLTD
jgi:hypothetical protein